MNKGSDDGGGRACVSLPALVLLWIRPERATKSVNSTR